MKDISSNTNNSHNAKEDIENIKKDIESLVSRLGDAKVNVSDIISEQLDSLSTIITDLKDKAVDSGMDNLSNLCSSTAKHPLRNLSYAFGIGVIIAYLIKR